MGKKDGKPRGRMTSYAFFVQNKRAEHKKERPDEPVVFIEFSKLCAEKWKGMNSTEKKRYNDMAAKDKLRHEDEMSNYTPATKGEKRKKDPNAPKRPLSAFFFFNKEERDSIKRAFPNFSLGEMAKELGRRWQKCTNKAKFEALAKSDKQRYEKEMASYNGGAKKAKTTPKSKPVAEAEEEDGADEDEDEDEDEEDEDSYEEDE